MGNGLLFPKRKSKKPRKRHSPSIIQPRDGGCYLCEKLHGDFGVKRTEEHHVFFGHGKRTISEAEGFKVYLCHAHHLDSPEAVHKNREISLLVQQAAQRAYEKTHSREEFMDLIGESYL